MKVLSKAVKGNGMQNRVLMITDVCDESFSGQKEYITNMAEKNNIHLTIIGVSNEFKSQICEKFTEIKGFNYFCAVKESDLKQYIEDTFCTGFFPNAVNIKVRLYSKGLKQIQVYGAPDSQKTNNENPKDQDGGFIVTEMKSSFPSEIEYIGGVTYTIGGLILVKLNREAEAGEFSGTLLLDY